MKKTFPPALSIMAIVILSGLLFTESAAAGEYEAVASGGHADVNSGTERIEALVTVSNLSTLKSIVIRDVAVIERSTGNNVINLNSSNCLFNSAAPSLPYTAPLPFNLSPLRSGRENNPSSITFSVSSCLEGVPRRGSSSGGNARDIAGFLVVITITAQSRAHIGGRGINQRREIGSGTLIAYTREDLTILSRY